MLNASNSARPAAGPVRKDRDRSLQVKVSLTASDEDASRRLVRKIRSSIARMLEQEAGASFRISTINGESANAAPSVQKTRRTKPAAPGSGAWWNF